MKAIGFHKPTPTLSASSFSKYDLELPKAYGTDLLVEVRATSVNPVDYKQRQSRTPEGPAPSVLGWDAAGIVRETGPDAHGFTIGDRVFYAGEFTRSGSNAEYQLIDHRLAARIPASLAFAEGAALPLTSLTAYEALFEKLKIPATNAGKILIIGGAGGVGSIAIQLLRALTDAKVYATTGRPESVEWVKEMGAHFAVDRHVDLVKQQRLGALPRFDYIFSTTHSDLYHAQFPLLLKSRGSLCLIDDPKEFDVVPFKIRSQSVHWELMFTKSLYEDERESQGKILSLVAKLIEEGKIRSTLRHTLEGLSPENLVIAHRAQESGSAIGKTVIKF